MREPVLVERTANPMARFGNENGAGLLVRDLCRCAGGISGRITSYAEKLQEDVVGSLVFRVVLEDRALKVLNDVNFAVGLALL